MFGLVGGARGTLVAPVVVAALVAALAVPLLGVAIAGSGQSVRTWRRRRSSATAERRARSMMSELCPHGWRAQITVGGHGPRTVALEWAELSSRNGEPIVSRRVWGETIEDALDAMVSDRRTDATLERIERSAMTDGARWPE